jgi:hemolysin III
MSAAHTPRSWSAGEELAHSLSHGAGFVAALVGAPFLLSAAMAHGGFARIASVSIFAATAILLYFASSAHHGLPAGRTKEQFETLDHIGIFLLIAGTYTPFTVGVLRGPWGWSLLVGVWILAATGVCLKLNKTLNCPRMTIGLYVAMGWLLITAKPLWQRMPATGLLLLLLGGVAYTGGLIFYVARRMRYHHLIWHVFVLMGTTCHYFAVLWYAAA